MKVRFPRSMKFTHINPLVCSVEDEGAGGGDAGGGSGGDAGGVAFSEAQRQEMIRLQNAANSAHHSRMQKVMDQKLSELRESFTQSLQEALSSREQGGGSGKSKPERKDGESDIEARVRQIQEEAEARVAAVEKKWEAERQARAEEAERNRRNNERAKLQHALAAAGVDSPRIRSAVALLHTEDQRVKTSESGEVVVVVERDGYKDEVSLADGIDEWLKSPEGKHYAPARDVHGSGASGGRAPSDRNGKPTKQELKRDLVRAVLSSEGGGRF